MAQMKEQIKAAKIELSNEEIANLSDTGFKILVIRILREMIEYGCKIKEEMKVIRSKIKENIQDPTAKGRKPGLKSTIWSRRKQ